MPKLSINNTEIEVVPGTSVLQACEQLGIEIPRFCYHDKLSVPGNCRMCLVEVEKTPKPQASCALPCADGMVVRTETDVVKRARKNVMEMLLINHPLDCPICDQGGECDLQDQAVAYGFDRGRFAENKRAVEDKNFGPLIGTAMTRCIQCTRCIRFIDEIAGTPVLGGINRSDHLEITTYVEQAITSELSGNLIDVCPVGALTNKPYAFEARPWELQKTETVDVMDAVGCSIRVDTRGAEVMRILPRLNEDVNEEWINDKTRFACDGLKRQRLDRPYVRRDGKLQPATWQEAFAAVAARLKGADGKRIGALAGDMADCESMFALKQLMGTLGSPNIDCRQDGATYDVSQRAGYLFNSGIAGIEQADAVLLIGCNPRYEATLVNARIRKRWLQGGMRVALIGEPVDLTYPYRHLGTGGQAIHDLLNEKGEFFNIMRSARNPMVILGAGALARKDGKALQAAACKIAAKFNVVRDDWNGFNVLQLAAARVGGFELGFLPQQGGMTTQQIVDAAGQGGLDVLWLLGADEIDTDKLGTCFVVYQGHHGDRGAHRADVILPGAAYTEKNAIYVNTEGRPQRARQAAFPPGEAREDWKIIRALSEFAGHKLPYDNLAALRQAMQQASPVFAHIAEMTPVAWQPFGTEGAIDDAPFVPTLDHAGFYMTNSICRASPTMAQCVAMLDGGIQAEAAE
ncbi:MAG: NADH-quinone oxidoreductase subunit G [Alphaproteobacteria bacterium]|nr:NADH-quinone oxidoreductase subunit G [Alphaproteobacteria bacterium]